MRSIFLSIQFLTLLLYGRNFYGMELKSQKLKFILTHYKGPINLSLPPLEQEPRNLICHIKLLKCYKKRESPDFDKEELKTLKQILRKKINDEFAIFTHYKFAQTNEFLNIAYKNNLLTERQKSLFEQQLSLQRARSNNNSTAPKNTRIVMNDSIPKDVIIASVLGPLVFCFLVYSYFTQ